MEDLSTRPEITELLDAWSAGDREALDQLIALILDDLRAMAAAFMARDNTPHPTLQPTALVNEVYLRLAGRREVQVENREQLIALLARTLRQILVDRARRKRAAKHGGGTPPLALDEAIGVPGRDVALVALDDALKDLASVDPRKAEVVHLSYFAGLSQEAIARVLGVSRATVKRDLKAARLWLLNELKTSGG